MFVLELGLIGVIVGVLSGFFGIGGGTILVPMLLFIGIDMKSAVGISVIQMVFSSVYGSYLNLKKGTLDVKMVFIIGIGGSFGAQLSAYIVTHTPALFLELAFLSFVLFAIGRVYFSQLHISDEVRVVHPIVLFLIGFVLGAFSISVGVGGSLLLVPILVSFLHIPIKKAISAGLFFVVFSSISGMISLSQTSHIDYEKGLIIGFASLVGVFLGISAKHKVSDILQKKLLILFYILVSTYLFLRLISHG